MKYHINLTSGEVGKCTAHKKPCPFGTAENHYTTLAAATQASEAILSKAHGDPTFKKPVMTPKEAAAVARRKNAAVRSVLKVLPASARRTITGGYLDLTPHIELSKEYIESIDEFSRESDEQYKALLRAVDSLSLAKKADQSASEALMKTANLQKGDGFKNEYVLAAMLSQYEDVEVYFPTGNAVTGGPPKVDMVVAIKGEQFPISVKKNNGTQIETYTSRSTVAAITPGANVIKAIEKTSNRIFFFRPKFQSLTTKPGEREVLRTLKDGSPKVAGASVRIEYGEIGKLPKSRPVLPEESAVSAFGGVNQTNPMAIHDFRKKAAGTIPNSSARLLIIGDFSDTTDIATALNPRDILSRGIPISREGLRKRGFAVTLRVSSMGNRTGDWVTNKSHITDNPNVTLRSYKEALAQATA